MKRFSKIFCIALVVIVLGSISFLAKAESCTTATPVVFIEAQMIPEKEVTCTVKSCARYCYTAEFIKQIFKDLDKESSLTSYAKNTTQIDGRPHYDWAFDSATIPDLSGIIGSYINQVQDSCRKSDGTTPTDPKIYNACVAAWQDLLNSWSSFQSTSLKQDSEFNNSPVVKKLSDDIAAIVKNNFTNLVPTNPINTDSRPTQAATTQNSAECADDTPSLWESVTSPIVSLFKIINIGIIHSTASVIKMGVNTMGWLMQPNNLWAPGISNNPAVIQAFGASVSVVNIVFSVVLVMMAIGTILNLKSYKINDLITKFIIVALLINFTLVIAGSILDLANYISLYFYNATLKSIQDGTLTDKWIEILTNNVCLSGWAASIGIMFVSIFINLLVFIAIAAAMLSVCGSLLKRGIMLMFLLIISPFAVICYLLPVKGMGQWWEKWKTSFLKQTFYGVYISVGFYLGTIMLSTLSISNQLSDAELSFASGIIKPVLAAGYLVFIVLLADEVAGGSAKASIAGATKLALGVAGGAALAGATGIVTKIGTSKQVSELATNLSKKGGLSAALGTRLSSFNKTSQSKAQESRKVVEAKLANENPEAYKDKVDNLLQTIHNGGTLNRRDQQFLGAALNVLPDKQRKSLSSDAQAAIPDFTDSMFKAGVLSKPEQKDINATVPVKAATFKAMNDYQKASDALGKERKGKNDPKKIAQFERDQRAAVTDNASDIINVFRRYREDDPKRKDDIVQSVKDLNSILTSAAPGNVRLQESVYDGLLMSNDPKSVCTMIDQIMKTKALDVSAEISGHPEVTMRTAFMENMVRELLRNPNNPQVQNIMREASKEIHNQQLAGALGVTQTSTRSGGGSRRSNNGPVGREEDNENEIPTDFNNGNEE